VDLHGTGVFWEKVQTARTVALMVRSLRDCIDTIAWMMNVFYAPALHSPIFVSLSAAGWST
jgi:hypothetical protein